MFEIKCGSAATQPRAGRTEMDLSEALWELHEAAMEAANAPSREHNNAVRDAWRKVERELPAFYAREQADLMERARAQGAAQ